MADVEDDVVDDAGSGAAGGAVGNGKRFEVKKWNAVGLPAVCAVRWPRRQAVRASARISGAARGSGQPTGAPLPRSFTTPLRCAKGAGEIGGGRACSGRSGPERALLWGLIPPIGLLLQVALWAWDIVVDNCAICRNHIMDLCELQPMPLYRCVSQRDALPVLLKAPMHGSDLDQTASPPCRH